MTDKELYSIASAIHRELLLQQQNRYKEQLRQLSLFVAISNRWLVNPGALVWRFRTIGMRRLIAARPIC